MSFLHRIDILLHCFGWARNPVSRFIEDSYWLALDDELAEFRAGRLL